MAGITGAVSRAVLNEIKRRAMSGEGMQSVINNPPRGLEKSWEGIRAAYEQANPVVKSVVKKVGGKAVGMGGKVAGVLKATVPAAAGLGAVVGAGALGAGAIWKQHKALSREQDALNESLVKGINMDAKLNQMRRAKKVKGL